MPGKRSSENEIRRKVERSQEQLPGSDATLSAAARAGVGQAAEATAGTGGDGHPDPGSVLDKKLAGSVNILPKASSLFFWNGEIEEATEILLLIKTKTSKVHVLSSYVRLVHPFEIPELFSLPMDQGDVHYLKWLEDSMED
ncbi:protein CutA homolog isoform X4 [Saccopteryx leptura]|uniref:protein CutA homolog isoform X4 n=1 Tax=Saccopteryx leptura TaxID=249018 RepID=UPI00339C8245